ncbi:MAG: hypothetical protein IKF10_08305 [Lachnospiraceae bacterium]|nr:hypothetical protein [Lachnospiraceae bacterium]
MKNNVRGSIIILEALAIIIISALILRIKANKDVVPPVISFPEGGVSYTQGDDQEVLFSGVSAIDEKDGDVTDSVIISSISVTEGAEAIAVYYAKDTSNNVAMAVRSVRFTPNDTVGISGIPVNTEPADIEVMPDTEAPDQSLTATPDDDGASLASADIGNENSADGDNSDGGSDAALNAADVTESLTDASGTEPAETQDTKPESADSVLASYENIDPDSFTGEDMERIGAALRSETEAARDSLPEGSPTIGLMVHAIYQDIGSRLNPLDLISSIDDAEDSIEYIFGQIHVEGIAGFTNDHPGYYVFRYYVIVSDGNMSNVARLYILVR